MSGSDTPVEYVFAHALSTKLKVCWLDIPLFSDLKSLAIHHSMDIAFSKKRMMMISSDLVAYNSLEEKRDAATVQNANEVLFLSL